ncbi:MAG: hypothetical protein ACLGXA_24440, partial [Acidobacteriota bacterium]
PGRKHIRATTPFVCPRPGDFSMAIGTEAAVQSIELEAFAAKIPALIPQSKTLYALAQDRFQKVPTSNITLGGATSRPSMRVPFRVQGGAAIAQGTGNGDAMGRGNMSVWQDFVASPVYSYSVTEITELARLATNGKKRGLIALKAEELKNSLDSTLAGLEALLYGDGSGAVTQIPSGATVSSSSGSGNQTSYITGLRAMLVTDNQVLQFFPSEGGSSRGSATVSINDPVTGTVWFSTALPAGVQAGDYIVVAGSSGAVGSGILGTTSWINSATSGTQAGINRATYPSRISSPSINLNGASITASLSQRIEALLGRAMGGDNKTKDSGIYLFPEDQAYAVGTTNYYSRQISHLKDDGPGNTVPDASKKFFQRKYGDRDVHVSYAQPSGRVDMMLTEEWSIGELCPVQLYDYTGEGDYSFPVPDPDGNGWLTSRQFAYQVGLQVFCSAPRHQLYVYDASQPTI